VQEVAFLDGDEEDPPVDEAEELLEVGVAGEFAGIEAAAQRVIGGMFEEAASEDEEGLGDADAHPLADAGALFVAGPAPGVPEASAVVIGFEDAGGVEDPPDAGEVRIAGVGENRFEVGFEEGRAGEGGGVAQQSKPAAVCDEPPGVVGRGVEELLEELGRGFFAGAAAYDGKGGVRSVEIVAVRGDDDGELTAGRGGVHGELTIMDFDRCGGRNIGVAESVAEELGCKGAGDLAGRAVRALGGGRKRFPLGLGNLEGAPVFVLELEPPRQAVVGGRLPRRVAKGGLLQDLREEEAALEAQRVEGEHSELSQVSVFSLKNERGRTKADYHDARRSRIRQTLRCHARKSA